MVVEQEIDRCFGAGTGLGLAQLMFGVFTRVGELTGHESTLMADGSLARLSGAAYKPNYWRGF